MLNSYTGKHNWGVLVENIQNYIKSLNWITKKNIKKKNVHYFNAHACILDPHTIKVSLLLFFTR